MTEYTEIIKLCVTLCACLVGLVGMIIILKIFLFLKQVHEQQVTRSLPSPATAHSSAASLVASRKAEIMEKPEKPEKAPKPGRSCGHCGTRIKTDPIKGLVIEEQSYLVYECPDCKKQTLLVQ